MNALRLGGILAIIFVTNVLATQQAPSPAPESGPAIRMVVEVIEATIDQNALPRMDFQKIDPKQHRVEKILTKLNEYGQANLASRFDIQTTSGHSVSVQSGQSIPVITGITTNPGGKPSHTINYQSSGTICRLTIINSNKGSEYQLAGSAEWSGLGDSGITLADNVSATIILNFKIDFSTKIQPDAPILLSRILKLPDRPDGTQKAQAIIFRIVVDPVSELEKPSAPAVKKK